MDGDIAMAEKSPPPHSYIVLKDKPSYPCGSLVKLRNASRYHKHSHQPVTLSFVLADPISLVSGEVAPLTEKECHLLDATLSENNCYTVYSTPGKLAWGVGLKVGDTVLAQIPNKNDCGSSGGGYQDQYTTAVIRWAGMIDYRIGERHMFGLEIMVRATVTNN